MYAHRYDRSFTLFLVSGVNQQVKALRFTSRMGLFVTLQYGMHASLIAMVPWSVQRIIQNLLSMLVERVLRYQHSGGPGFRVSLPYSVQKNYKVQSLQRTTFYIHHIHYIRSTEYSVSV